MSLVLEPAPVERTAAGPTRTKKSALNLAAGFGFNVVGLLSGMVATPWICRWLGFETYGSFKVLTDWFGYLNLFELGLTGSVTACLAHAVGSGSPSNVRTIVSAAIRAYLQTTLLMLAAGVVLVAFLPRLMIGAGVHSNSLRTAGLLLLIPVALAPLVVGRALAEARQRAYVVNSLLTIQSLIITSLLVLTAWAGWGLSGQALATVLGQVIVAPIVLWYGMREYPGWWSTPSSSSALKAVQVLRGPTLIHAISGRVGLLSDNIILAGMAAPALVAPFYLTQRLAVIAQTQLQGIGGATWAGLTDLYFEKRFATIQSLLFELTALTSGLSLALAGPIAAYNHHFINRWVGASLYAGEPVNLLASVNLWLVSLMTLWSWPLSGTGQIARWAPFAVAFAVINVGISIAGTIAFGMAGPLLGTLVAFLSVSAWGLPYVLSKVFGASPLTLWASALAPLRLGLPYAALVWLIAHLHTPLGWAGLVVEMGLATSGALALWWLGLSRGIRLQWRERIRNVLNR